MVFYKLPYISGFFSFNGIHNKKFNATWEKISRMKGINSEC